MKIKIEKNQIVPYSVAILSTGVAIFQALNPKIEVKTVEKIVEVDKTVDRTKKTKRITKKPDGTVIETQIIDDSKTTSESVSSSNIEITPLPRYSVGVDYNLTKGYQDFNAYNVRGGVRLGNLPLHFELGVGINAVTLGARFEF